MSQIEENFIQKIKKYVDGFIHRIIGRRMPKLDAPKVDVESQDRMSNHGRRVTDSRKITREILDRKTKNEFVDVIYGDELQDLSDEEYKDLLIKTSNNYELGRYTFMDLTSPEEKEDITISHRIWDTDFVKANMSLQFIEKLFSNGVLFAELTKRVTDIHERKIENPYLDTLAFEMLTRSKSYEHLNFRSFELSTLMKFARVALESHSDKLSEKAIDNIQKFSEFVSLERLATLGGTDYTVSIDEQDFTVSKQELINILMEDDKEFKKRFEKGDEYSKKLAYTLMDFVYSYDHKDPHRESKKIFDLFDFPESAYDRFLAIRDAKVVDYRGVNQVPGTKGTFSDRVSINPALREAVYDGMPKDYSSLEKSIYIYGRLCQILSYDPDFFASGERGKVVEKHISVERLSEITPENNEIVCYEFTSLYSKFLEEEGINNELVGRYGDKVERFSGIHSLSKVKADDIVFTADSTSKIIRGDLVGLKVGAPIAGIRIAHHLMDDSKKKEQLKKAVEKVSKDLQNHIVEPTLDELISAYKVTSELKREEQTPEQKKKRFDVYASLLTTDQMNAKGLSRMAYLLDVTKTMYGRDEQVHVEPMLLRRNLGDVSELTSIIVCRELDSSSRRETFFEYSQNGEMERINPTRLAEDIQYGRIAAMKKDSDVFDEKLEQIMKNYLPVEHE